MGSPIISLAFIADSSESTISLGGTGSPKSDNSFLKSSLSSAFLIVSTVLPINLTLYLSKTPCSDNSTAKFNPVCPPNVGKIASGCSFSMI